MSMKNQKVMWYVLTAYKAEYETRADLALEVQRRKVQGIEPIDYFVPMYYKMEKRGGKEKLIKRPLLPNFVFIRATLDQVREFKIKHPNLTYYKPRILGGKFEYQTIPDHEMEMFRRVASLYEHDVPYFQPTQAELEKGDRVRIIGGRFNGVEGILISQQGKDGGRVAVNLTNVLAITTLEIEPQYLQIISFASGNKHIYKKFDAYMEKIRLAMKHYYSPTGLTSDDLSVVQNFICRMSRLETQTINTQSKLHIFLLMSHTVLDNKDEADRYLQFCQEDLSLIKSGYQRAFVLTYIYVATREKKWKDKAQEAVAVLPDVSSSILKKEQLLTELQTY